MVVKGWRNFTSAVIIFCFIHYSSTEKARESNDVTDNKDSSGGTKQENGDSKSSNQTLVAKVTSSQKNGSSATATVNSFISVSTSHHAIRLESNVSQSVVFRTRSFVSTLLPDSSKLGHSITPDVGHTAPVSSIRTSNSGHRHKLTLDASPYFDASTSLQRSNSPSYASKTSEVKVLPRFSSSVASLLNTPWHARSMSISSSIREPADVFKSQISKPDEYSRGLTIQTLSKSLINSSLVPLYESSEPLNIVRSSLLPEPDNVYTPSPQSSMSSKSIDNMLVMISSISTKSGLKSSFQTRPTPSMPISAMSQVMTVARKPIETPAFSSRQPLTDLTASVQELTSVHGEFPNVITTKSSNVTFDLKTVPHGIASSQDIVPVTESSIFQEKRTHLAVDSTLASKRVTTQAIVAPAIPASSLPAISTSLISMFPFPPDKIICPSQSTPCFQSTPDSVNSISDRKRTTESLSGSSIRALAQTTPALSCSGTSCYLCETNSYSTTDMMLSSSELTVSSHVSKQGLVTTTTDNSNITASASNVQVFSAFKSASLQPTEVFNATGYHTSKSSQFPSTAPVNSLLTTPVSSNSSSSVATRMQLIDPVSTKDVLSTDLHLTSAVQNSTHVSSWRRTSSLSETSVLFTTSSSVATLPILSTKYIVKTFSKATSNIPTSAGFSHPSKTAFLSYQMTATASLPPTSFVKTEKPVTGTSSWQYQSITTARPAFVSLMASTGQTRIHSPMLDNSSALGSTKISSVPVSRTYSAVELSETQKSSVVRSTTVTASIITISPKRSSVSRTKTSPSSAMLLTTSVPGTKAPTARRPSSTARAIQATTITTTARGSTSTRKTITTTWRPSTETEPITHQKTTSSPVLIGVPAVLTKKLDSFESAINIEFYVDFPGILEAYKLQIIAQRHGRLIVGGGESLRTWYEVHYFQDYKYEPYVAGEFVKKDIVHRTKFNFTFGQNVRCQKEQIRFKHCNGPLEKGSYRFQLQYHVHESVRKSTFSKVYTTAAAETTPQDDSTTGLDQSNITIAVIAVLAVLLVLIIIIAVILYRRKNSQNENYDETEVSDCTLLTSLKRSSSCSKSCYGRGALGGADSSVMLKRLTKGMSRPVHVKDFIAWVNRSQADSDFRFAEEFESIRDVGRDQSHEASDTPENRGKNRYVNVLAYDRTRVKLSYTDDEIGSDYINANYIHGYKHPRSYIATQGPLPGTTDDFWRMIWEQNTFNIVMATQCTERNRVKCHDYWPGAQPTAYGDIVVSLLSEFAYPEWIEREFLLDVEDEGSRRIKHFQYTAWPDHGVPKNAITVLEFTHTVRSNVLPGQGPLVVHCSAGVGRTGTLIAIDTIMDRLQEEDTVDVYWTLCMMRMQRCNMVQTEDQYIFIHRVILEHLKSRDTVSPFKGYCLLPKVESEEANLEPSDSPATNRDSGLALLLGEYDTERAEDALESVA